MQAMVLERFGGPLRLSERAIPDPDRNEILLKVEACAVCRTDLHLVDGELPDARLPIIPGHEIVARVVACGVGVKAIRAGDRVGVPWLGWTCGECFYCRHHQENLCEHARFTGHDIDGGFADYAVADARFCFSIPPLFGAVEAAPLLCAGLIGHRALAKVGDAQRVGIFGFGAAAHIVTQVARHEGRRIFAFTRRGDLRGQAFARALGAVWAGSSTEASPEQLDGAIIFAPVGPLVPAVLRSVRPGGVVVCGGIHMSDIPSFPYRYLWGERTLCSVANLTRRDGIEFLKIAAEIPVQTTTQVFPLVEANRALDELRSGRIEGAAVLVPADGGG